MSFILPEIAAQCDGIFAGLDTDRSLYAAHQALAWATDPLCYRSPANLILGTQEGLGDCSAHLHPLPSSDTYTRTD